MKRKTEVMEYVLDVLSIGEVLYSASEVYDVVPPDRETPYWQIHFHDGRLLETTFPVKAVWKRKLQEVKDESNSVH